MPIYEYECPTCGRFEVIQKVKDNAIKVCPSCKEKGKSQPVQKAISASAFHLKGTGWYKTDYSSGSGGASTSRGAKKKSGDEAAPATSEKTESGSKSEAPKASCGTGCGCH